MAKGYEANKERVAAIAGFGKALAKRAKYKCEWCEASESLKPVDLDPAAEPTEGSLAMLCESCRGLQDGKQRVDGNELRKISGAIWHAEPLIALGAAKVLAASGEDWAREAVEDSMLDDDVKAQLLGK